MYDLSIIFSFALIAFLLVFVCVRNGYCHYSRSFDMSDLLTYSSCNFCLAIILTEEVFKFFNFISSPSKRKRKFFKQASRQTLWDSHLLFFMTLHHSPVNGKLVLEAYSFITCHFINDHKRCLKFSK